MGHLGQPAERREKFGPLGTERHELLLAGGREAIATAAAAIGADFPGATNPSALLHAVQHWIKSSEGETQRTLGLLLDAAGHLIAVQPAILQDAEDRQFRCSLFYAGANHSVLPYM